MNGRRNLKSFSDRGTAYEEAKDVALKLAQGEIQVAQLTAADRTSYGLACAELKNTGIPLEFAAKEYAEAHRLLGGRATLWKR